MEENVVSVVYKWYEKCQLLCVLRKNCLNMYRQDYIGVYVDVKLCYMDLSLVYVKGCSLDII